MLSDSALSHILPWETSENQVPINHLHSHLNYLIQMTNVKASTQPTKSTKIQNPRSKTYGRTLVNASTVREAKTINKSRTWSFNYQESTQCQAGNFPISQGKMQKILDMSSYCTPLKAKEMSTKATKQNTTQADESSYSSRYDSKEALNSFTNAAIKSIKQKPTYQKITFSEFVQAKKILTKDQKYSHKSGTYFEPEVVKSIHSRIRPQRFTAIVHPKAKTCQLENYLTESSIFEKRGIKTNRRKLYSSKKRCEVVTQESTMPLYLSQELSSFTLILNK